VLVVDDEPYITDLLAAALKFEGFDVRVASRGSEALDICRSTPLDMVLLDVMLPDMDGTQMCQTLRESGNHVPVVFLTARDATEDKIVGLGIGDDYVTKPFSLDELVARLRAVLRRSGGDTASGAELRYADLVMNVDTHEVWRQGALVELTATEFNVLEYLLDNARRVVPKAELLDQVWGLDFGGDPNIVETYISYLRKKIDDVDPPLLHTVRRVGYVLRLPR
jgi:two-component system OmpR family response regulator